MEARSNRNHEEAEADRLLDQDKAVMDRKMMIMKVLPIMMKNVKAKMKQLGSSSK
jgi:hypothetical protein